MNNRELAYELIDKASEEELAEILRIIAEKALKFPVVEPDDWELQVIEEDMKSTEKGTPLEAFAKELGIDHEHL